MIVAFVQSGNPPGQIYLPYLNIGLSFGLTGVSSVLLLMSEIVILMTALSGNTEKTGFRASAALLSLFQIAAVGLFSSLDLLLFFIFWDIGIIALFLMINMLGSARRRQASINFILYELFASSMLLLGIILLYAYSPSHSLGIAYLASVAGMLPANVQVAVLVALFLAFMTNMAIFPMHLWLPDAYTEASTQGSMLLSGVLTKFGGYGMLILFGIHGLAGHYSFYIAALAAGSCIYAALVMIRQKDLKRIVAYSAMLEMGVIMVAIAAGNAVATEGAVFGMFSQGISVALAFLAVGVVKELFDERNIDRLRDMVSGAQVCRIRAGPCDALHTWIPAHLWFRGGDPDLLRRGPGLRAIRARAAAGHTDHGRVLLLGDKQLLPLEEQGPEGKRHSHRGPEIGLLRAVGGDSRCSGFCPSCCWGY